MAQIIRDVGLGEKLGTGVGKGLLDLATNRLGKIQQRELSQQQARGLESLGFNQQQSGALANLDPQILQSVVKQKLSAPNEANYLQALQSLLGGDQQTAQMPQGQQGLPQQQMLGGQQQTPQGAQSQMGTILPQGGINAQQATKLAELGLKKQEISEKKNIQSAKEKAEAYKATKPERKAIVEGARLARQSLHDLNRLEELNVEGKLDTPGYVTFLKNSGLDIPALMNPESEEFQKISQGFLRGLKDITGGRITNYEVEQFLKTIPSLSQSPEGRKRVISHLKNLNRISLVYADTLKDLVSKNQGVPPLDLLEQLDDAVAPKVDKLSDLFKKDLAKPVPKSQHKLVTGLQAVLGGIAGAPGTVIGGIGKILGGGGGGAGAAALL